MARAKTGIFYIKAIIDVDSTVTVINEDLSVYVDPVNRQGLLIRSVDYIWYDKSNNLLEVFVWNIPHVPSFSR